MELIFEHPDKVSNFEKARIEKVVSLNLSLDETLKELNSYFQWTYFSFEKIGNHIWGTRTNVDNSRIVFIAF